MPEEKSIRGFYNLIQKENGLRYKHQFLVRINLADPELQSYGLNFKSLYGEDWFRFLDGNQSSMDPTKDLTFYAKSTSLPETSMKTTPVSFLAAGFRFPGIVNYTDSWSVNVLMDQHLYIYTALRQWQELMSSWVYNNGGKKTIPNIDADLLLLNNTSTDVLRRFKMRGIFIKELPELPMEYKEGSSDSVTINVTFTMQWFEECNIIDGSPIIYSNGVLDGIGIPGKPSPANI